METRFRPEQLNDPVIAEANDILRKCVHCGFCTATCPSYVILGDELDSPRGRIYLIKGMLESGKPPSASVVRHIDRCLSCLSCMSTCPSGVDYQRLVDAARVRIERDFKRPLGDRIVRTLLAHLLPYPRRFAVMLRLGVLGKLARPLLFLVPGNKRFAPMLDLVPWWRRKRGQFARSGEFRASGRKAGRVILLTGCAQPALAPQINDATIRILNRAGYDVVAPPGQGCCGALPHHIGREDDACVAAKKNIDAWSETASSGKIAAVIVNASGCGTAIKDYGILLKRDAEYAHRATRFADCTRDISEFLHGAVKRIGKLSAPVPLKVAYQSPCSLQHGQKIIGEPVDLLRAAGFEVATLREAHLCCGSAGTYNILQPEIAGKLRQRKIAAIDEVAPDVIATGNIGCLTQLASASTAPVVHTVELLDWAAGGPVPPALRRLVKNMNVEAGEAVEKGKTDDE